MNPRFLLNSGYQARTMEFVLSRDGSGWKFYGRDGQGYLVPARNPSLEPLCDGMRFATKGEAATIAKVLSLPPYAIWNGRKRSYEGKGARITAYPRDWPVSEPRDETPELPS